MEHHSKRSEASLINHTRDKSKQPKAATLLYHTQSAPGEARTNLRRRHRCHHPVLSWVSRLWIAQVSCFLLLLSLLQSTGCKTREKAKPLVSQGKRLKVHTPLLCPSFPELTPAARGHPLVLRPHQARHWAVRTFSRVVPITLRQVMYLVRCFSNRAISITSGHLFGGHRRTGYSWHIVSRGQGCCYTTYKAEVSL